MQEILNPPFIISILIALTVHEWAHAFVADRLGDHTARDMGRLTLNPIAHLDPLGTLMFFLVHFGWGKPVPVDPRNFRNIRRDSALVSLAGPLSNLILTIIAFVLLLLIAPQIMHVAASEELLMTHGVGERLQAFFTQLLTNSLFINLGLMAFNLLPIAPLDGSKILEAFIPYQYAEAYDTFMDRGPMILIGLLVLERALGIPILITWISFIMDFVLGVMMAFT
ncbi:site-2 protease family protein [Candidatus Peribacteria bacterium]|nr:site-2 protease family protein [Candidatus Peribacteria bacterium]